MSDSKFQTFSRLLVLTVIALVIVGIGLSGEGTASAEQLNNTSGIGFEQLQTTPETPDVEPNVDHSEFPALEGPFNAPQDVTRACLACHPNVANDIMSTVHWTWEITNEETGQTLGKKNLINNFCISIQSNEPRCTSCHIGYGWEDNTFDFDEKQNIDCLVCHDTTGTYEKFPTAAGYPATTDTEFPGGSGNIFSAPDYAFVAQNIGKTSNETCGTCHFYGGGGDYVKHGDLDSSLIDPSYEVDVHMSTDGANFNCTTCHMTEDHQIAGSRYTTAEDGWQGCENCHTTEPHELASLNHHTEKVACQTCHIPEFARGGLPTKMTWDWSTAGQKAADGSPLVTKDENGLVIYDGKKGDFTFSSFVVPDYVWYNGNVSYTMPGETIDPTTTVTINQMLGDINDPTAKIYPVKTFTAVQPYDSGNNILAIPHLFGSDDAAYWKGYDWNAAISAGMEYAGLSYSGQYDFVETVMYWPTTHMVAPAEDALSCNQCHTTEGSRIDFAALGFSEEDVDRLTHFPPGTNFYDNAPYSPTDPETCLECHEHDTEYNLWHESTHADNSVGCIACHQLEKEGEHPEVAMTMSKSAAVCGSCHINEYRDWETSIHSEYNVTCVTCHNPHSQEQMTIGDFEISCQTCHGAHTEEIAHSTHKAEDLICNECHMNTDNNTGHSWNVESDTCLKCHAENIHAANAIITGDGVIPIEAVEEMEEEPAEVNISLPIWAAMFAAVVIGTGATILLSGKNNTDNGTEDEE